jgi:hypothetical protein
MVSNQPHVEFVLLMHVIPAKLAAQAAQRRGMKPADLIAEIASGVLTKGSIERQLEHAADWRLMKRLRQADTAIYKRQKRAKEKADSSA